MKQLLLDRQNNINKLLSLLRIKISNIITQDCDFDYLNNSISTSIFFEYKPADGEEIENATQKLRNLAPSCKGVRLEDVKCLRHDPVKRSYTMRIILKIDVNNFEETLNNVERSNWKWFEDSFDEDVNDLFSAN